MKISHVNYLKRTNSELNGLALAHTVCVWVVVPSFVLFVFFQTAYPSKYQSNSNSHKIKKVQNIIIRQ